MVEYTYDAWCRCRASNNKINRALKEAGYKTFKTGKDGLKKVLKEISKSSSVKAVKRFASSALDFVTGIIK